MEAENWASKPAIRGHGKLIGLAVLFVILALTPLVVRSPFHLSLLILVGINAILAMTFVLLLRTGLITLAIAAFWGVGAYSSTMLSLKLHLSFWLCLPASARHPGPHLGLCRQPPGDGPLAHSSLAACDAH